MSTISKCKSENNQCIVDTNHELKKNEGIPFDSSYFENIKINRSAVEIELQHFGEGDR